MIRHHKSLAGANAPSAAGEVTATIWNAPHFAFDFVAAMAMSPVSLLANVPVGSVPLELGPQLAGGDTSWRTRYDFTHVDYVRLTAWALSASPSNARIAAQWSRDEGVSWSFFDAASGPQVWNGDPAHVGGGYHGGPMASAWVPLLASGKRDVLVRFVGWGAVAGEADVNWGALTLWAR